MTTLTLQIDTPENAELLAKLLSSLDFVKEIETYDEYDELTPELKALLDDRLELIEQGKATFKTWDEVKKSIKEKYGL